MQTVMPKVRTSLRASVTQSYYKKVYLQKTDTLVF